MKRSLLLLPAILVLSAAVADARSSAPSGPPDAQARAAALLSRSQTPGAFSVDEYRHRPTAPSAMDAHARAAALLSSHWPRRPVTTSVAVEPRSSARASADAHAQAAALLSGSRMSADSQRRSKRTLSDARAGGEGSGRYSATL